MGEPIVTFTTDFSNADGYVGAVRGVILSICPAARIVDISHSVPPQDVMHAAFVLHTAAPYFPKGTFHLAVVDPQVGTQRRAICLCTDRHLFVGPDNGIFSPFLDEARAIFSLENETYWRDPVSRTFHGRDVFGPVVAHLAAGLVPEALGPQVDDPVRLPSWQNLRTDSRLEGAVVHIDHFGNCITSISPMDLEDFSAYCLWLSGSSDGPETTELSGTYADSSLGEPCWYLGSSGLIELAINGGNAAGRYAIERGDPVFVEERNEPAETEA